MKNTSGHHQGLRVAILIGMITAIAAVVAIVSRKGARSVDDQSFFEDEESVLGI